MGSLGERGWESMFPKRTGVDLSGVGGVLIKFWTIGV